MSFLEIRDLTVKLGGLLILEGVSLSVEKGEVAALVGPNGAGKTTLLKAILGLVPLTSGSISLAGEPAGPQRRGPLPVGYVPQRLDFDRGFPITVAEFVGLRLPGRPASFLSRRGPLRQQVMEALERVGAARLAPRPLGKLSGGELQRVLIAYALLGRPEMLLLDEPISGLDVAGEETFYQLVDEIRLSEPLTVLMVSHDLHVVYRRAQKVFCLNRRLLCSGSPTEVLTEEVLRQAYGSMVSFYEHDHPAESPGG
jgi:ABC-type Mn2+/Zn2+ transport system ATPase subunit